jgi:hypothetical protein
MARNGLLRKSGGVEEVEEDAGDEAVSLALGGKATAGGQARQESRGRHRGGGPRVVA